MTVEDRGTRRRELWALVAVVVCGLAIGLPSSAVAVAPCSSRYLSLTTHGFPTTNAHGRKSYVLVFRNRDVACFLQGYPPADLLDHGGHIIQGPHARVAHSGHPQARVDLPRNEAAYLTFSFLEGDRCPDHIRHFPFARVGFYNQSHLELYIGVTQICATSAEITPFRAHA